MNLQERDLEYLSQLLQQLRQELHRQNCSSKILDLLENSYTDLQEKMTELLRLGKDVDLQRVLSILRSLVDSNMALLKHPGEVWASEELSKTLKELRLEVMMNTKAISDFITMLEKIT